MTVKVDLLEHELKGHWLAKPRLTRDQIRAKHRAAHFANILPKPASAATMARARAVYEDVRSRDPSFDSEAHAEAAAHNRHRQQRRPPYDSEGADETIAWLKHRARYAQEIPVKLQIIAWAKAIMVLDDSEVLIRDLIERELAGRTGTSAGPKALLLGRQLSAEITVIRQEAVKLAFRLVKSGLGDVPIHDISLARWAKSFALSDSKGIDIAIQTGLIAGLDNTEIARKVVGSMGLNGVDGVTEFTRHKIAHLGRAAIKASNLRTKRKTP
jgi:hypothetical protein